MRMHAPQHTRLSLCCRCGTSQQRAGGCRLACAASSHTQMLLGRPRGAGGAHQWVALMPSRLPGPVIGAFAQGWRVRARCTRAFCTLWHTHIHMLLKHTQVRVPVLTRAHSHASPILTRAPAHARRRHVPEPHHEHHGRDGAAAWAGLRADGGPGPAARVRDSAHAAPD